MRVYGSTSSAKLVNSLKAELKADRGTGTEGSLSPKRSKQYQQEQEHAQYFSGFASTVIAQATGQGQPSNQLDAKKAAALDRLNGHVRLNSAEALERFHKRERA